MNLEELESGFSRHQKLIEMQEDIYFLRDAIEKLISKEDKNTQMI